MLIQRFPLYSLIIAFLVGLVGLFWYVDRIQDNLIETGSLENAELYTRMLVEFRTVYTSEVIRQLENSRIEITHDYENKPNAVPLPATLSMKLGERFGGHLDGAESRLYSKHPFPWRTGGGLRDDFSKEAWGFLQMNPNRPYYKFEDYRGQPVLRYAVADRMRAACVNCHNTHPQSPKKDWQNGDVRGVLEIVHPLSALIARKRSDRLEIFFLAALVGLFGLACLAVLIGEQRRNSRELEYRIERRTEQLKKALDRAEAAARAKGYFLANMSHEIRTPMNGVVGMTELLLETPLNEDQKHFANSIRRSGESLMVILDDILDFSKLDIDKVQIESVPLDIAALTEETANQFLALAENKNLELIVRIAPDVPERVLGDPTRIRQILVNLIGNAIKFTGSGFVLISLCSRRRAAGVSLLFTLQDTGIGLPAGDHSYLFEQFTQADESTTRRFGGTGLGLAICSRLVQMMNGRIGADNRPDQGSRFWFEIPLPVSGKATSEIESTGELEKVRILIVDDSRINREVAYEYVTALGMNAETAGSAREGLSRLQNAHSSQAPFRIVLVNYLMPGMDGKEFAGTVRDNEEYGSPVLVLATSVGYLVEKERLLKNGFSEVLIKPYHRKILKATLVRALAPRTGRSPVPDSTPAAVPDEGKHEHVKKKEILVAEDHPDNQNLIRLFLEQQGCRVDIAENGAVALELACRKSYDLIFLDIQMPILNGYETARALRRGPAPNTPIIAVSANVMHEERERCIQAGMNEYIAKPFTRSALQRVLEKN